MDTLSSTVSTLKVPVLHTTPRELYHFKNPSSTSHQLPLHHFNNLSSTTKPKKTAKSFTDRNHTFPIFTSSGTSFPKAAYPNIHRKAASGYAAALLDKAVCHSSLEAVQRDVQRLAKLLKNDQIQSVLIDPFIGEKEKGEMVKEVVNQVKVNKYLAGLLRMLIERNKVGKVSEVLEEFGRIYDELSGTRVVFVSSVKKMEEDELFLLAKRVQKFSGASKVRIKNLVDETVPSFAV